MKILLQMGAGGSFLILIILVFRRFFSGRVPRRFQVFLWICAMSRLLLPFSVPVEWGPALWADRILEEVGQEDGGNRLYAETLSRGLLDREQLNEGRLYKIHLYNNHIAEDPEPENHSLIADPDGTRLKIIYNVIWTVWLSVAVLLASMILIRHCLCLNKYRASLPVELNGMEECKAWLRKHRRLRKIQIRISDQAGSPLAYGLFRPVILLPANLELKGADLTDVLEHEWAHIKNWDILTKYLLYLTVCIYWFHPLIWLMALHLNRDMELACDEAVLRNREQYSRESYALLLLRLADGHSSSWQAGVCFTKYSEMEERIRAIMKKKRYTWKTAILAVAMIVCMVPVFTSAAKKSSGQETNSVQAEAKENSGEEWKAAENKENRKETGIAGEQENDLGGQTGGAAEVPNSAKPVPAEALTDVEDSEPAVNGEEIARMAKNYIGNPYLYAGTDLETGVDSSGFVKAIYEKAGIELPHSTEGLLTAGTEISVDDIREGDLILYGEEKEDHTIALNHAAIYIGDSQVIHASNVREGIKLSKIDYRPLAKAVRIIH